MAITRSCLITTALIWAVLLGWQCREKPSEPQEKLEEVEAKKPTPKIILDLAEFADLTVSDTTAIEKLLLFKEIDSIGNSQIIDIDQAARAFKQKMTTKKSSSFPLLEIQNSDKVVLVLQGKGYGGPIWAKVLINKVSQQIDKLVLDHSAESEGYGTPMTYSSFEGQFTGRNLGNNAQIFGLRQNKELLMKGNHEIDGLSGATITSKAVVEMMNEGLKSYATYLELNNK